MSTRPSRPPGGPPGAGERWHPHPWAVVAVTTFGSQLVFLNSTAVVVALPAISADLRAAAATADWLLLGFMLALSVCVLVFSRLSDMVGRRRLYLGGLALMIVASLAGALVTGIGPLIAVRVAQGVAAAAIIPNANAMIADAFPADRLALGLSVNIMMASAAMIAGPVLGGWLLDVSGWRSLFLAGVPFGLAAVLLGLAVLRRDAHRPRDGERLDVPGAVIVAVALGALILGINRLASPGDGPLPAPVLIGVGAILIGLFVLVERTVPSPLVDIRVVTERARAFAYATAFLMALPQAGMLVLVVLYLQIVRGSSASEAGLAAAAAAAALVVTSPAAGVLARRLSPRAVSSAGCALSAAGYAALLWGLDGGPPGPAFVAGLLLIGAGNGVFTAPNTASIMAALPASRRGIANGVRSVLFNSAQTAGNAVVLVVVAAALSASGVAGYDVVTGPDPGVVGGFRGAGLVLLVCALGATASSLARGGPWSVPTRTPDPDDRPERGVQR